MGGRSFLANSGAEANEAAIKLARKYSRQKLGENRYEIITAYNSFHGRTLATLAATGQPSKQKPFEPLTPGFKHIPFNNVEEMEKAISEKSCAVMIEPIQGEGGVIVPDQSFLGEVRKLCDDHSLLLIIDEIQTGVGRTGELFAYQHYGIEPDILTLAKGLGGGVPIGVMMARDPLWEVFDVGSHGSTFGGNALACAAALATLRIVLEEDLPSRAKRTGEFFLGRLKELHAKWPHLISQVRGKGLMLAMEFKGDIAEEIVRQGLEEGLVLNGLTPKVIRFLPPLTIEESAIERLIDFLNQVLIKLEKQH
jgi:predicted acetylornithine/succinylornithine family transaminase